MIEEVALPYEVIGTAIVSRHEQPDQHAIKLLYRGGKLPWWTCSAGLELMVPGDFAVKAGDTVSLTIKKVAK